MLRYVAARILSAILVLWAVVTLTFFLMHAAPGGPFDREQRLPAEVQRNLEHRYGLDQPLHVQYGRMLTQVLRLDFGVAYSSQGQRTVMENIAASFPVSLELGLYAMLFAFVVGAACAMLATWRRNTWVDRLLVTASLTGLSVPSIVLGPLLLVIFAVKLRWLPLGGWDTPSAKILPTIALGMVYAAVITRLTRSALIEILEQDFIRAARARGLSEFAVMTRHALRGAMLPVISYLGPALASVLTGSVVVERIFNIPGISEYFISAAQARDYPMMLGVVILYSSLLVLFNALVDIAYVALDPRIRSSHGYRA